MERFKGNWHRRMLSGKSREQRRTRHDQDDQDGGQSDGYFLQPAVAPEALTEALRSRLEGVGLRDPWLLDRSDIYEKAITNLGVILDKAPLPGSLREAASSEIALLANSLLTLFTGRVRFHATELTDDFAIFSGYFEYFDGQTKRVSVEQRVKEAHHLQTVRMVQPKCQIFVREMRGRSNKGRAIAGSDIRIRCGLSSGSWITDNKWSISIDAGITSRGQRSLLKAIEPITQAYNECRKYPESFYYLQDADTENTFHFGDPDTKTTDSKVRASQFITFNRYLNLVFRALAKV